MPASPVLDALPATRLDAANPADHQGCYGYRIGWIVACTHPQAEHWANTNLRQNGYQTYLPLIAARRRDRAIPSLYHRVLVPAFPGYLFVHYDSRDPRRPIRETPGVRDVIRCGSQIQWCPAGAVEAVEASLAVAARLPSLGAHWAPGMACSPASGALSGCPAVVISVGKELAVISVMMFGHLREVTVSLDSLRLRDQ